MPWAAPTGLRRATLPRGVVTAVAQATETDGVDGVKLVARLKTHLGRTVALADQVLSGLSNFLVVVMVARAATPEDFGHFVLVYGLLVALLGLTRRLWGTRLSMTASPADSLTQLRRLLGSVVCAAPVGMCLVAVPSVALIDDRGFPIVAVLALALPVIVAQDLCRYAAVAAGRPLVAAASDLVWVAAVGLGYAVRPTIVVALVIWSGGPLSRW